MYNINYISNVPVENFSGGWSGMNHFTYKELEKAYTINTDDTINPPYYFLEKAISKVKRITGGYGDFVAFSDKR